MPQRIADDASSYLSELGSISSGLLIIVVLAILGGNVIMVSIFAGINKYREFKENERRRKESARQREERAIRVREEIKAEGRSEAYEDIRTRLIERGIDPNDILPPEENGSRPSA